MSLVIVRWYASQGSTTQSHVIVRSMEEAKAEVKRISSLPWSNPTADPYKPEVYVPTEAAKGWGTNESYGYSTGYIRTKVRDGKPLTKFQRMIVRALVDLGGKATKRAIASHMDVTVGGVANSLSTMRDHVDYPDDLGSDVICTLLIASEESK